MQLVSPWMTGPILRQDKLVETLELLIAPADRIVIEGDNQKQADFLSRSLVKADPKKLHDLHLIISSISRPEHLTLFERGIAKSVDFAFAGPQSLRVAQLLEDGVLKIGAIHTYVELYARLLTDLTPNVAGWFAREQADREGNLYTGPGTEDTPVIVEAAAFHDGIVIGRPIALSRNFRASIFRLRGSMSLSRRIVPTPSSPCLRAIRATSTISRFSSE